MAGMFEAARVAGTNRGLVSAPTPYLAVHRLLEDTSAPVFLTGRAGSGKSTLLRDWVAGTKKTVVVLAPTGIAAINVGGQTVHSFFKFPPRYLEPRDVRKGPNGAVIRRLDALVIDEVSMVRADLMDTIDGALRLARNDQSPFGGVQMIVVGDPHQLPPVVDRALGQAFEQRFGGSYFFNTAGFRAAGFTKVELRRVFRQSDADFLAILDRIRRAEIRNEDGQRLNTRVSPRPDLSAGQGAIVLTPTNDVAARINAVELARLPGETAVYPGVVDGDFDAKLFPVESDLALKRGARVMITKNDPDGRWVNGTIGLVEEMEPALVRVRVGARVHDIEKTTWERFRYDVDIMADAVTKTALGAYRQFPLRLAWALTVHKAQGLTFDSVHIDFGSGMFAHGQAYVALSRCRTLDGLSLSRPLRRSDLVVDPRAFDYGEEDPLNETADYVMARLTGRQRVAFE